jgi:hypothetical protein
MKHANQNQNRKNRNSEQHADINKRHETMKKLQKIRKETINL